MKKLLITSLILTMSLSSAVFAASTSTTNSEPATYTERFIQKHTQKLVDTEKKLQADQKAREEASAKQQEELQKKIQANKDANLKKQQEFQKKLEADKKARQQKFEQKKQLFNQLISE